MIPALAAKSKQMTQADLRTDNMVNDINIVQSAMNRTSIDPKDMTMKLS